MITVNVFFSIEPLRQDVNDGMRHLLVEGAVRGGLRGAVAAMVRITK
jgi:hypothetical protein